MTTSTTDTPPAPALRRTPKQQTHRAMAVCSARQGLLICEDGSYIIFPPQGGVSAILRALTAESGYSTRARVVYLQAGTTAESVPGVTGPEWYKAAAADGWTVEYVHDSNPGRRRATYTRGALSVDVRHISAWFGDAGLTTDLRTMLGALRQLEGRLRSAFGHAVLLGTPAQTGLDLLERSLPFPRKGTDGSPVPVTYPTLPDELRSLLHRFSPQGRKEVFNFGDGDTLPGFYYYDARLAYGACLRHVPCGAPEHHEMGRGRYLPYERYTPGLYRATVRVPSDWRHVGLLPDMAPDGERWNWPARPGQAQHSWYWGTLLDVAVQHGWTVHIHESWTFTGAASGLGTDPLHGWGEKLLRIYQTARPDTHGACAPLIRSAVRSVLLDAIGSFHRRGTTEVRIYPHNAPVPFGPDTPRRLTPYGFEVELRRPLTPERLKYAHPEWSGAIWALNTRRLTLGLLQAEPATLVGCNADARYSSILQPAWVDAGKIGDYRLKGRIDHSVPRPKRLAPDLLRLKKESERNYHGE